MNRPALLHVSILLAALSWATAATGQSAPSLSAMEQEVMANLRAAPLGSHVLADLNLPEAYLRRVADRVIRSSFEDRFRIVVAGPAGPRARAAPASSHARSWWLRGSVIAVLLLALGAWKRQRRSGLG